MNNEKRERFGQMQRDMKKERTTDSTNQNLLEDYLALPKKHRDQKFPSTASAATMIGISQRTVQFWVEIGEVEAVFIGRKCRVSIDSLREYLRRRADERIR